MGRAHERETTIAVAAVSGVLDRCWAMGGDLDGVDWPWLLARLDAFGLGALVFAEAERTRVADRLPAGARDGLRRRAEDTAAESAQLLAAALRTGALLDAAGIPWMPMKGVALALAVPAYFSIRPTSDFDVLVRPEDLARAAEVFRGALRQVGETVDYGGAPVEAGTVLGTTDVHLPGYRTREDVGVELHHGFPDLTPAETRAVWSRAAPPAAGSTRWLPDLADLLGTMSVHVVVHHQNVAGYALRHLADARQILALGADTSAARARFDVRGREPVATTLRDLAEAAAWAERGGAAPAVARLFAPGAADRAGALLRRVRGLADRTRDRVALRGLRAVFPDRAYLETAVGGGAGAPLPLLHLRRWARLVVRTFRGG